MTHRHNARLSLTLLRCVAAVGGTASEDAAAALLRPHAGRLVTLHGGMVTAMDRCASAHANAPDTR
jgi:hypothetical protein